MSQLIDQLKRHEGYRSKPYTCSAGKLTIGYGRNLDDVGISDEEAEVMLESDVLIAQQAANTLDYYETLDSVRQDVIVNMIFNMGMTRFLGFKNMNAALYVKDYNLASTEMLSSKWAVQVGDRSRELSAQMKNGEYAS